MKQRILAFVALATLLLPLTVVGVYAQEDQAKESITVSPAVSEPITDAGSQINAKMTVVNDGQSDYKFLLYARPFSVESESYDPVYKVVDERSEAYQWVQFEKNNYTLAAGERIEIPYTITVPENAAGGGHYAVLFAETQPSEDSKSQIERKKRVGSLLYMTVNGDVKESGSLEGWDANLWQSTKPVSANLRIKNDGNVHFQADSKVKFENIFGKALLQLNQQQLILPDTTRKIPVNWENPPTFGIFKVSGSVKYLEKTEQLPVEYIIFVPKAITLGLVAIIALIIFKIVLPKDFRKKVRKSKTRGRKK